jgi:hypothetical protein
MIYKPKYSKWVIRKERFWSIIIMASIATVFTSNAETITANSLSRSDVAAALALASSGDTVFLPAGSSIWTNAETTTENGVTIPEGVAVKGAGIDQSTVVDSLGVGIWNAAFYMKSNSSLSHITLKAAPSGYSGNLVLIGNASGWRIHNCKFTNIASRGVHSIGDRGGSVIDGNTFEAVSGGGTFQLITIQGNSNYNPPRINPSNDSWSEGPKLGSDRSVYIEDNTFWQDAQGDATLETYIGGRAVFRNNISTNFVMGVHGNDSSVRSGHVLEAYNNTFVNNLGSNNGAAFNIRGGTALIYNNTITATGPGFETVNKTSIKQYRSSYQVNLANGALDGFQNDDGNQPYHATDGAGIHTGSNNATTLTDTTKSWPIDLLQGTGTYSTGDTQAPYVVWNRTDGSRGYITTHTANTVSLTLSGGSDNDWDTGDEYVITWGYPGLDQPGWAGPTTFNKDKATDTYFTHSEQVLTPIYIWGNTFNGSPNALPGSLAFGSYTSTVQPDSDMFIQEGREWFDDGTKPSNYTPYTYPHPLRSGDLIPENPAHLKILP